MLASYSSPFILIAALAINLALVDFGIEAGFIRLMVLSLSFPIGLLAGRFTYLARSHVEILYDDRSFQVFKGRKRTVYGDWKNYKIVSIIVDSYGRPDLRLYKSLDGEFAELPVSRTGTNPQGFRDRIAKIMSGARSTSTSLQVAEAA